MNGSARVNTGRWRGLPRLRNQNSTDAREMARMHTPTAMPATARLLRLECGADKSVEFGGGNVVVGVAEVTLGCTCVGLIEVVAGVGDGFTSVILDEVRPELEEATRLVEPGVEVVETEEGSLEETAPVEDGKGVAEEMEASVEKGDVVVERIGRREVVEDD